MLGVATQVHEDLVQLSRIGEHGAGGGVETLANRDGGGQRGAQEPQRVVYNLLEGDGLARLLTFTAEGEDLLHQILRPVRGREDFLQLAPCGTL